MKYKEMNEKENKFGRDSEIEAQGAYLSDKMTAEELVKLYKDVFKKAVGRKKDFEAIMNKDFLRDMYAKAHKVSPDKLVKKMKELIKLMN